MSAASSGVGSKWLPKLLEKEQHHNDDEISMGMTVD